MLCARRTLRENPCYKCIYRKEHCHGTCSAYKNWKLKDKYIKNKIDKKQSEDREVDEISRKHRSLREI